MKHITILGICGSLRVGSSNRALLAAASKLAPDGTSFVIHDGLGSLPLFDPDLADSPPESVLDFRAALAMAEAVMIASPEYAHGITGVLKNALDWVVGSGEFSGKPVAPINSSLRSFHAHESLIEILRTMDSRVIPDAPVRIPLPSHRTTENEISADALLTNSLEKMLDALVEAARELPVNGS